MSSKSQYDCQTRPNGRGGWEIAEIDAPAGLGIGNYSSESDAYAMACYNFDASRIKRGEQPMVIQSTPPAKKSPFHALTKRFSKKPAAQPAQAPLVRRVKALTK